MKIEAFLPLLVLVTAPHGASDLERASALLKRADEALASAQTVQATYTDTSEYAKPYRDLRQTGVVSLSRSGQLRVEISRSRRVDASQPWVDTGNNTLRVSDGSQEFSAFFHPHSTQVRSSKPAPAALNEAPLLASFFGGPGSPGAIFDAAKEKGTLENVQVNGSHLSFVTGSVERQADFDSNGLLVALTERKTGSKDSRTWRLQSVKIGATLATDTFHYTPPADALPYGRGSQAEALEPGTEAPELKVAAATGQDFRLNDYRGKVVVLKFWATWCWPCNQSMPETEALAAKYGGQGVEFVAVAIKDSRKGFDAWVAKHPQYAHIRFAFEDPLHGTASQTYAVSATPTTYVIGRDGHVVTEFEGFTGSNPRLEEVLASELKK